MCKALDQHQSTSRCQRHPSNDELTSDTISSHHQPKNAEKGLRTPLENLPWTLETSLEFMDASQINMAILSLPLVPAAGLDQKIIVQRDSTTNTQYISARDIPTVLDSLPACRHWMMWKVLASLSFALDWPIDNVVCK